MSTQAFLSVILMLSVLSTSSFVICAYPQTLAYIELEEYKWNRFPLKVLVDMNEWSVPSYSSAVREALDCWMKSIWNFTNTFGQSSLPAISYLFYLTTVNTTKNYDVLISFRATNIPPESNTVGLTECKWDALRHEPISPIKIEVTTFSATADDLSVRNIVMHEFGHALGLGHASVSSTSDGPELMYYISVRDQTAYPSTLDVYGLIELYEGKFKSNIFLPSEIPYIMLSEGAIAAPPPSETDDYLIIFQKYAPMFALLALAIIAAAIFLAWASFEKQSQNGVNQPCLNAAPCMRVPEFLFSTANRSGSIL